jgi:hypothetical protein
MIDCNWTYITCYRRCLAYACITLLSHCYHTAITLLSKCYHNAITAHHIIVVLCNTVLVCMLYLVQSSRLRVQSHLVYPNWFIRKPHLSNTPPWITTTGLCIIHPGLPWFTLVYLTHFMGSNCFWINEGPLYVGSMYTVGFWVVDCKVPLHTGSCMWSHRSRLISGWCFCPAKDQDSYTHICLVWDMCIHYTAKPL